MTHRTPVRRTAAAFTALASLLAAGCGSSGTTAGSAVNGGASSAASSSGSARASAKSVSDVLRIPYLGDMSVPDPDVFYDLEGDNVTSSVYDNLVTYAPGTTTISPNLATKWTVSPDRLTYTFTLRPGVKFHDGTPFTAASVVASFKRRLAVNQAPAYMLMPIATMQTPNPLTVVVKLRHPVNPFLDYLASTWGPRMIGPAAIVTHAGKDHGQSYLQTHDDGTGPFTITGFQRGNQYTLSRFDGYWGSKPFFRQILIKIIPDISQQQLQLQNGGVDAILHSFPAANLGSLPSNVRVAKFPAFLKLLLYVNTQKPPFDSPAVRAALRGTINEQQLISEAYSGTGTASTGPYPSALLSAQPALPYKADPKVAAAGPAKASTKNITLAFTADESGVQRRVGEILQAGLQQAGWNVTVKQVQLPQVYDYAKHLKSSPDLLLMTNTPDAAYPDTWARILFSTTGGLNFLGFSDKQIDATLDQAVQAPAAQADALYRQIGQEVIGQNEIFFLGDINNVFVLSKNLTGITQVPAYPWTVNLAKLARSGG